MKYPEQIYKDFNGCQITIQTAESLPIIISIFNREDICKAIDLRELPIKIDDWYYVVGMVFSMPPFTMYQYTVNLCSLMKVDNLTYVEELAKEKNLA